MTVGVVFTEQRQNAIASQIRAELYSRIYKYAAEDFVNHQDFEVFLNALIGYLTTLEGKLTQLGTSLASHQHMIPPHTHVIPPHTHTTVPHFHVGNLGAPTSPDVVVVLPIGQTTSPSVDYPSNVPIEPSSLTWKQGQMPTRYTNTSGVVTNLNNKVVVSSGVIGDPTPAMRRSTPIPEGTIPIVPPYATPTLS